MHSALFYLAAIPAVVIMGMSKSGFGGSLGILAVPLLAAVISPAAAAAILLPILILLDIIGLATCRGQARIDLRNLRILLPGAIVGIVFGTLTFRYTSDAVLRALIGLLAVGFVLQRLLRRGQVHERQQPNVLKGTVCGALSGFASFIANAGGPPFLVYLVPQNLDKRVFAQTAILFFAVVNFVKILPYAWLGLFDAANLSTSLMLAPFAPVGFWLGREALARLDQVVFYRVVTFLVLLAGGNLLWSSRSLFIPA